MHIDEWIKSGQKIFCVILGIFVFFVVLEIGLRIEGKFLSFVQDNNNKKDKYVDNTCIILCVGESHTALGGRNSYPAQLERILNAKKKGVKFKVINKGIIAGTSSSVLDHLEDNIDTYKPDIVVVMMGLSDGKRPSFGTLPLDETSGKNREGFWEKLRVLKLIKFLTINLKNKRHKSRYAEEEKRLLRALYMHPWDQRLYFKLGNCFLEQGKYKKAEEMFTKLVEGVGRSNPRSYVLLAMSYMSQGKYEKEEKILKKAIELFPSCIRLYTELHDLYRMQGMESKAEDVFKLAIRKTNSAWSFALLGRYYYGIKRYKRAEQLFKLSLEIEPTARVYALLGKCYRAEGEYDKAEDMFKKSIEVYPSGRAYFELAMCFKGKGDLTTAIKTLKKAMDLGEKRWDYHERGMDVFAAGIEQVYVELAICYKILGKDSKAEEIMSTIEGTGITRYNYQRLKEIVLRRVGKLVCVQYPMLNVELLKNMVGEAPGVVFVDNEKSFKDAVRLNGYNKYFFDNYGGILGHGTALGNRLLAENVANVILNSFFVDTTS